MARHLTRTGPIGRTPTIPTYLANQKSQKENQAPEEHHSLARGEGKLPVIEISYSYMEKYGEKSICKALGFVCTDEHVDLSLSV